MSKTPQLLKYFEECRATLAPIIKAKTYLLLDYGEYSDYGILGFFVVLKDFSPATLLAGFLEKENPEKNTDAFLAVLLQEGYLLELEYSTLTLGSYEALEDTRLVL
jgi:hypothetical protein